MVHKDLEKQGDPRDCFVLVTVTLLWHVAKWVSCAPPHHTLPTFLNLKGILAERDGRLVSKFLTSLYELEDYIFMTRAFKI